jgi:hypothetical protein
MKFIFLTLILILTLIGIRTAHSQEYEPWNTYKCIGIPASTAMNGDEQLQEWPLNGQIGDDLVVCKITKAAQ